jgi:outer membrane protein assembly factor BamB
LYGTRVSVIVGDPATAALPPYFASLVVSEGLETGDIDLSDELVRALFQATRPYGGVSIFPPADGRSEELQQIVARLTLEGAEVRQSGELTLLTRVGRLPGSADWTHEYGDPSNTLMSHDELVKAPLGVLWFGGPAASGDLFYNRHFWGPSMAVIGGRMFIQGPGNLAAIDVYTGRILWQEPLEDVDNYRPGRRGNDFEGRLAGFHFLAVEDSLYLVLVDRCVRLDPETGEELAAFRLENPEEQWGRIRVEKDVLITEVFGETAGYGVMPVAMAALDRHTGERRWRHDAELSFPVSAVSADTLYCFDGALEAFYADWKRRGVVPEAAENKSVVAIDLATGEEKWRVETDNVFTWLAFSREQDTLIASNKLSITAFAGADGYQLWTRSVEGVGFRGHPETLWDRVILWNDQILDQRGPGRAWEVLTGELIERVHPMTREQVDWEFTKSGHHCNYAIANPHLMTFRADTAGFCDIDSGATSRLQGYRPGCRNSLIPANGVLNSPNFAHGCVCGYPLFTSLALIHRPEAEVWSYNAITMPEEKTPVERLAINFGAPGDRQDERGTLWLDYPNRGGSSPAVGLRIEGDELRYFHQHSTLVHADEMNWVAASGVEGASRITVALNNPAPREYTLRLVFSEPDAGTDQADRVFDVVVQGKTAISELDVLQKAGGRNQGLVREVAGVSAAGDLTIELVSLHGKPVLCGFELLAVRGAEDGDD